MKSLSSKRILVGTEVEVDLRLLLHVELDCAAQVGVCDCGEIGAAGWSERNECVAFPPHELAKLRC